MKMFDDADLDLLDLPEDDLLAACHWELRRLSGDVISKFDGIAPLREEWPTQRWTDLPKALRKKLKRESKLIPGSRIGEWNAQHVETLTPRKLSHLLEEVESRYIKEPLADLEPSLDNVAHDPRWYEGRIPPIIPADNRKDVYVIATIRKGVSSTEAAGELQRLIREARKRAKISDVSRRRGKPPSPKAFIRGLLMARARLDGRTYRQPNKFPPRLNDWSEKTLLENLNSVLGSRDVGTWKLIYPQWKDAYKKAYHTGRKSVAEP